MRERMESIASDGAGFCLHFLSVLFSCDKRHERHLKFFNILLRITHRNQQTFSIQIWWKCDRDAFHRANATENMKTSYHTDLLRGRCQDLPDVRSKVVRVFISSTFSGTNHTLLQTSSHPTHLDTLAERDSLIENVFPKLKDYCREKYGLEFQVCFHISSSHSLCLTLFDFDLVCRYAMGHSNRIIR